MHLLAHKNSSKYFRLDYRFANKSKHFAAITQVAEPLRAIDGYQGSLAATSALKLAPMLFVRPGELRAAEWKHINFDTKEWRYLVTKTQAEHIVPLSSQAVAILQELHPRPLYISIRTYVTRR